MSYEVKKDGPATIFTGSLARVAMVKDLLEMNGIASFVQNEFDPYPVQSGVIDQINLVVSGEDVEQALLLVKDFNEKLIDQ